MREIPLIAIVVVAAAPEVSRLVKSLDKRGFATKVINNPHEALDECRRNPPDLAIVEKTVGPMGGVQFLAELLKVSWTTSTIMIADEEEDLLHQETEGLGILGSISALADVEGLERLIDRLFEMLGPTQRTAY